MALNVKNWRGGCRQADLKNLILYFMAAVYPLLVVPNQLSFLGNHPPDYFYAPRYLALAAASLLALAVLLKEKARIGGRAFVPLGFFFFFALAAAALAAYPATAWVGAPVRYTGLCTYLFCAVLFVLASRADNSEKLPACMAAAAVIVSFLAVLQVCGLNPVPHEPFRRALTAYGTLGNPDYLGTYAAFVLPAALSVYAGRRRPAWLAAAAVIYAGLLVSFNWGAWMGAVFGLAVVARYSFAAERKRAWLAPALVLPGVTLLFAAGIIFWGLAGKVGVTSPLEQAAAWQSALRLLPHCWAFGLGPDHLTHVARMLPFASLLDKTPSLYLETAVTMGMFALIAYLAFLGFVLWEARHRFRARPELPAMAAVYLVQGLFHFETILVMPLFWIVLGMLAAGGGRAAPARETAAPEENIAAAGVGGERQVLRDVRRAGGFTLLEVIVIIAVLGFLAAMFVPFIGHLDKAGRVKATRERLEAVRAAVAGPANTYDERGRRVVRGYAGDMDALPRLYKFTWDAGENRWQKPEGAAVGEEVYSGGDGVDFTFIGQPLGLWEKFDRDTGIDWASWKGPYLAYPRAAFDNANQDVSPLRRTEGILADAWGRALFFIKEQDARGVYLLVISAGPDGKVALPAESSPPGPLSRGSYARDAPANKDNVVLEITPDEWYTPNLDVQEEQTRRILESIKSALTGPPDAFDTCGRPLVGGYLGDMGQWPKLWQWTGAGWEVSAAGGGQPRGLWAWDPAEGYSDHDPPDPPPAGPRGFAWRGPYLAKPWGEGENEVLRDSWGTPLHFEYDAPDLLQATRLTIASAGRDKKIDTADDNIALTVEDSAWKAAGMAVKGRVVNLTPKEYACTLWDPNGKCINYQEAGQPPAAEVTVTLYHQPAGDPLTASISVPPGESRTFALPGDVFAGRRRIEIQATAGEIAGAYPPAVFVGAGGSQCPAEESLVVYVRRDE